MIRSATLLSIANPLLHIVTILLGSGCTPVPKYRAPDLPPARVASLTPGSFIRILRIDGADPVDILPTSKPYLIAPGERSLLVAFSENAGQMSFTYEVNIRFHFIAGHEYALQRYNVRIVDKTAKKAYQFYENYALLKTPKIVPWKPPEPD